MPFTLGKIFSDAANVHPDNLSILHFEDDNSTRSISYTELQTESSKVFKICKDQQSKIAALASSDKPTHAQESQMISSGYHEKQNDHQSSVFKDPCDINIANSTSRCMPRRTICNNISKFSHVPVIGVMCHHRPSAVACILGILQGYAYFFLSPDWTKSEIKSYLRRVVPKMLLVDERCTDKVSELPLEVLYKFTVFNTNFICLDFSVWEASNNIPDMQDLAYLIPTSGTTGVPKIVYIPHKCIIPNILDFTRIFQTRSDDRVFCASPLTFDPSVIDLFVAFHSGAALIMVDSSILKMPDLLIDVLVRSKTTVLQATPSLMFSLGKERLRNQLLKQDSDLRILALGGEIFPKMSALCEWIGNSCSTRIFNLYGITEVSCWASLAEVSFHKESVRKNGLYGINSKSAHSKIQLSQSLGKEFILQPSEEMTSIGEPLSLTVIKVVNDLNEEIKGGDIGEIIIGGHERVCYIDECVEKTKQNFPTFTNINETPLVMRLTGDRGVVHKGNIYCLGRLDRQVKRHGQKVSLLEIERQCETLEYMESCHVVVQGDIKLIAFVKLMRDALQTVDDVFEDLKCLLSPWKVPDDIIIIDTLPFNSHGKADHSELLKFKSNLKRPKSAMHSITDVEKLLIEKWESFLKVKQFCGEDNFILSGGNSISAVAFVEEIEEILNIKIPTLLDILLNRTFTDLIDLVIKECKFTVQEKSRIMCKSNKKLKAYVVNDNNTEIIEPEKEASYSSNNTISTKFQCKSNTRSVLQFDPYCPLADKPVIISRRGITNSENKVSHEYSHFGTELLWKYNLGKCIDASPTMVDYGRERTLLLVGSHSHKFACIDAKTGSEHWCLTLGGRIESSSCVSVDGTRVYVGCYDFNLYCINIRTGDILWKYGTEAEIKSSPITDDETGWVLFGSHDKNLYCLTSNGSLRWKLKVSVGSLFSSPFINGNLVFSATLDGVIAGIEKKSGNILWKVNLGRPIFSSPVPYSKGIVFGTVSGDIYGYSCFGHRLWEFKCNGAVFSSAFIHKLSDGHEIMAIGCHNHCVYFFNSLGQNISMYCGKSPIYATPFIYSVNIQGMIRTAICETSGKYYLVDLSLNNTDKQEEMLSSPKSSYTLKTILENACNGELFSSPIVYNGKLFICCRDDFVYCYKFV